MNSNKLLVAGIGLICFVVIAVSQGDAGHYAKDGLTFDYGSGWTIADTSNADAQQLTLTRHNSDSQIVVFAHRGKVETPEKFASAKKAFIDPYVKSMNDRFVQMGATAQSSPAKSQIGGLPAEGVRLRASLGGEGAETSIFWLTLDNRIVMLTLFAPDTELKQVTPSWDTVRNTIKIEPPPAKTSPTPTPKKP